MSRREIWVVIGERGASEYWLTSAFVERAKAEEERDRLNALEQERNTTRTIGESRGYVMEVVQLRDD